MYRRSLSGYLLLCGSLFQRVKFNRHLEYVFKVFDLMLFGKGQHTVKVGFFFAKIKPKSLQSQLILETINSGFFFVRFFFREKKSTAVFVISTSVIAEISTVMLSIILFLKKLAFFSSIVLCCYSTICIQERQLFCYVK